MLIEFRVRNFRSFGQESALSMVASGDRDLIDTNIVETGIPAESYQAAAAEKDEYSYRDAAVWQRPEESFASGKTPEPAGPQFSLVPDSKKDKKDKKEEGDMLELTAVQEAKAAQ